MITYNAIKYVLTHEIAMNYSMLNDFVIEMLVKP